MSFHYLTPAQEAGYSIDRDALCTASVQAQRFGDIAADLALAYYGAGGDRVRRILGARDRIKELLDVLDRALVEIPTVDITAEAAALQPARTEP